VKALAISNPNQILHTSDCYMHCKRFNYEPNTSPDVCNDRCIYQGTPKEHYSRVYAYIGWLNDYAWTILGTAALAQERKDYVKLQGCKPNLCFLPLE